MKWRNSLGQIWVHIKRISELCSITESCSKMFELSPHTTRGHLVWLVVSLWALQNCMCAVQFISWSRFCTKTSWMSSLKGYKVFGVALIIKENNKDIRIFTHIYSRVIQHFWRGSIFWWRYNQIRVSSAILANHLDSPHIELKKTHLWQNTHHVQEPLQK